MHAVGCGRGARHLDLLRSIGALPQEEHPHPRPFPFERGRGLPAPALSGSDGLPPSLLRGNPAFDCITRFARAHPANAPRPAPAVQLAFASAQNTREVVRAGWTEGARCSALRERARAKRGMQSKSRFPRPVVEGNPSNKQRAACEKPPSPFKGEGTGMRMLFLRRSPNRPEQIEVPRTLLTSRTPLLVPKVPRPFEIRQRPARRDVTNDQPTAPRPAVPPDQARRL